MQLPSHNSARRLVGTGPSRHGFTLFELMICIVIVAALFAIILVVGTRVVASNKGRVTSGVLRTLETILEDYQQQTGKPFPQYVALRTANDQTLGTGTTATPRMISSGDQPLPGPGFIAPVVDARWGERSVPSTWPGNNRIINTIAGVTNPSQQYAPPGRESNTPGDAPQPSTTLFLLAASEVVPVQQRLSGLDSALMARESVPVFGWDVSYQLQQGAGLCKDALVSATRSTKIIEGPVVRDAFGLPIRFVTPLAHGGYGPFDIESTSTDGQWVASTNPSPLSDLAFKVEWVKPKLANNANPLERICDVLLQGSIDNTKIKISRRGRPTGMNRDATNSKSQIGDADEGFCRAGRPYFYSSGSDGDPRSVEDNVYTDRPIFNTDRGTPANPT